jgi:hypothetical protein
MYTIVRQSGEKRWYRTSGGAWFTNKDSFYRPRLYDDKIDAEIAKNWIEMRERRNNIKIIKAKKRRTKAQY